MPDLSPLDRAIRAARRGHTVAAQRLLDAVLADTPDDELALSWRARVTEDPAEKVGFLTRILASNSENRWAADALSALGDVDAAAPPRRTGLADAGRRPQTLHHLQCPNCGGQIDLHPDRGIKAAACTHCGSVLDLTGGQAEIIGRFKKQFTPIQDILPGAEGTFEGERHLVTGWLRYKGWDDESSWQWDEWQLVSDTGAVRYLSYSREEGFLLQTPIRPTPKVSRRGIELPDGRVTFSEVSPSSIIGMAGELTWRPRLDETLQVGEAKRKGVHYSAELTASEVEVVGGSKLTPLAVWSALGRDDKVAALKAKEERAKARRRSAARLARLCGVAAALFGVAGWLVSGMEGTVVFEESATSDVEAVVLPSDFTEKAIVRYDTLALGPIRLSGKALTAEVRATLPVGPPLSLFTNVAFVGTGGEPILTTPMPPLEGPAGTPTTATSLYPRAPGAQRLRSGDAFDVVLLIEREWRGGPGGVTAWSEPATIPFTVTLREVWVPGPFWGALAVALLLGIVLFLFSRSGPR